MHWALAEFRAIVKRREGRIIDRVPSVGAKDDGSEIMDWFGCAKS